MPGAAAGRVLSTPDARQRKSYVALIANDTSPTAAPKPVTITIGASAVAAGTTGAAVTVTSVTLPIDIRVGQRLEFEHATGRFLFEATENIGAGAQTELTGIAREGIPADATCVFPARVGLMLNVDTSETTGTTQFSTFDHQGTSEVARGESEQSITSSAGASYYNAGLETVIYAQRNGLDVSWIIEQPNPDASSFEEPPYEWGVGVVNDVSSSGGVNDKLQRSLGISVKGGIQYTPPVKAA